MTLKKLIELHGISGLAKKLGVTRQAVDNWHKGRNKPTLPMIKKMISISKGKLKLNSI